MDISNLEIKSTDQKENYSKFLDGKQKVGFTNVFVEKPNSVVNSKIINDKCRGIDVRFEVRYCILLFGDDNEFEVHGIVTDCLSISDRLPLGGFNSNSNEDTSKLMEEAVVLLAHENELLICDKVCSWPFAKAITTPMTKSSKNIIKYKLWES